jgi:hypothetical protein
VPLLESICSLLKSTGRLQYMPRRSRLAVLNSCLRHKSRMLKSANRLQFSVFSRLSSGTDSPSSPPKYADFSPFQFLASYWTRKNTHQVGGEALQCPENPPPPQLIFVQLKLPCCFTALSRRYTVIPRALLLDTASTRIGENAILTCSLTSRQANADPVDLLSMPRMLPADLYSP